MPSSADRGYRPHIFLRQLFRQRLPRGCHRIRLARWIVVWRRRMSAVLYTGELLHSRTTPVGHSFVYAASFVAVDLATLVEAGPRSRVVCFNRRAFLFIPDRD